MQLRSEDALHLVSYEGVKAAGLDPFLVLLDRVMGLPPVTSNQTSAAWVNSQPPSRVVAATSFLVQFIQARSDLPSLIEFRCAQRFAERQLLSLLPISCRPFADWTAAFNERERAAAASVAPKAHRWAVGVLCEDSCALWCEGTPGGARGTAPQDEGR